MRDWEPGRVEPIGAEDFSDEVGFEIVDVGEV